VREWLCTCSSVWADGRDDRPEVSFTRLAYSENPTGCLPGIVAVPGVSVAGGVSSRFADYDRQVRVPELGGDAIFSAQGWGWG